MANSIFSRGESRDLNDRKLETSSTPPKAIITRITAQTGSYFTEFLLTKGYEMHGPCGVLVPSIGPGSSTYGAMRTFTGSTFSPLLRYSDATTLRRFISRVEPHEFSHLAGQSHVGLSFDIPDSTCKETADSTVKILEVFRDLRKPPNFYHASSSELFGSPLVKATSYWPVTPCGCRKTFATKSARVYWEAHGLFVCNGSPNIANRRDAGKILSP